MTLKIILQPKTIKNNGCGTAPGNLVGLLFSVLIANTTELKKFNNVQTQIFVRLKMSNM